MESSKTPKNTGNKISKYVLCSLALLVIFGVFVLYLQPAFMLRMADMVWTCI